MTSSELTDEIPGLVAANYGEYAQNISKVREKFLDYPRCVSIETQVKCNAKCGFCPYPVSPRKGEEMDEETFEKIISDLEAIPQTHKFVLTLSRINEPLLDRRLERFHQLIKEKLPNAWPQFWSNGTMLRPGKFEWMAGFPGSSLSISLNSVDDAEHQQMMGFGLKSVLPNLDYVHSLKADKKFPITVKLRAPFENREQAHQFYTYCQERWPLFEAGIRPYFVWTGDIDVGQTERDRAQSGLPAQMSASSFSCGQWYDLHILANGYATKCCIDEAGFTDNDRFNCQTNHVLDVYAQTRVLREELPPRKQVAGCEDCLHLG